VVGPVAAVPVPVGGRLPVMVDGAGMGGVETTGVGSVFSFARSGMSLIIGVGAARIGACGTPATVLDSEPGRMVLSVVRRSAKALYILRQHCIFVACLLPNIR